MKYDIIGDIHGYAQELKQLLDKLGYKRNEQGVYVPPEKGRKVIFTGDYIDRGRENFEVIDIVRNMVDAGYAHAMMGNHDFNASLFHTSHPDAQGNPKPLRRHDEKNVRQHQAFIDELALDKELGEKNIAWLKSLPVYMELDGMRFVHALWDQKAIDHLKSDGLLRQDNTVAPDRWHELAVKNTPGCDAIEMLTKGFEVDLPVGVKFKDADGSVRKKARLKWWGNADAPDLKLSQAILDVPHEVIPDMLASEEIKQQMRAFQQSNGNMIFFGHYWMKGEFPTIETKNALCIDQSVAKDGHLAAATVVVENGKLQGMDFSSVKSRPPQRQVASGASLV